MTLKRRIMLIASIDILMAIVLIINKLMGTPSDYIQGMGAGLFSVTIPFLVYLTIKYKDKEYKEEYDLSQSDERIKRNCEKSYALGFQLQTLLIISAAIISYVVDFSLYFPVLSIAVASLIFVKVYYRRLNR